MVYWAFSPSKWTYFKQCVLLMGDRSFSSCLVYLYIYDVAIYHSHTEQKEEDWSPTLHSSMAESIIEEQLVSSVNSVHLVIVFHHSLWLLHPLSPSRCMPWMPLHLFNTVDMDGQDSDEVFVHQFDGEHGASSIVALISLLDLLYGCWKATMVKSWGTTCPKPIVT